MREILPHSSGGELSFDVGRPNRKTLLLIMRSRVL
jgi:hypothetical protein